MWYLFLAHMDAGNGKQGDALVLGSENWRSFFLSNIAVQGSLYYYCLANVVTGYSHSSFRFH